MLVSIPAQDLDINHMFVSVPAQDLDINQYCLAFYSEMYTLSIAFVRVLYALYNFNSTFIHKPKER